MTHQGGKLSYMILYSVLLCPVTLIVAVRVMSQGSWSLVLWWRTQFAQWNFIPCYSVMGHRSLDKAGLQGSQNNDDFSGFHHGL